MTKVTVKILLVEDDEIDRMAFERFIKAAALPYAYRIVASCDEAHALLHTMSFDVAILDHCPDGGTAIELRERYPDLPIIMTAGQPCAALAEQAGHAGASAYFTKDLDGMYLNALPAAIERAIQQPLRPS